MLLRHVGIVVQDLPSAEHFWTEGFGCCVRSRVIEDPDWISSILDVERPAVTTVKLELPQGGLIELLGFESHPAPPHWQGTVTTTGLTHVALTVDSVRETLERMHLLGARVVGGPGLAPDGNATVAFIRGPEGILVEIVQEHPALDVR